MKKFNTALIGLALLAVIMLIGGLVRSRFSHETIKGVNGSGWETGIVISPLIVVSFLLIALAFGWHKWGRN